MGKLKQRLRSVVHPLIHVDVFARRCRHFLKGGGQFRRRINDLVNGGGAKLFFVEDCTKHEGRSTPTGFLFSSFSNSLIFSNFSYPCLYFSRCMCNFLTLLAGVSTLRIGLLLPLHLGSSEDCDPVAWGFPLALPTTCHSGFYSTFSLAGNVGSGRDSIGVLVIGACPLCGTNRT